MKKVLAPLFVALLATTFTTAAHAADTKPTPSRQNLFQVNTFNVLGLNSLPVATKNKIETVLNKNKGTSISVARLLEIRAEIQKILSADLGDGYIVNIPPQTVAEATVVMNILNTKGQVTYIGTKGYDEENLKRSLPSVANGLTLENGVSNLDVRQLSLAQQNPGKSTLIRYIVTGLEPVKLEVRAFSKSKYINSFEVSNTGSETLKYKRFSYSFINANLTNRDDELYFFVTSNLYKPKKSYAYAVRYAYPFYSIASKLEILALKFHSKSEDRSISDQFPVKILGNGYALNINFNHITTAFDVGNPYRNVISATYQVQKVTSEQDASGIINRSDFKLTPIAIGNNFTYNPSRKYSLVVDTKFNWLRAGAFGTSEYKLIEGLRPGVTKDQSWINLNVTSRYNLDDNKGSFITTFSSQYTNSRLISTYQKSLAGTQGSVARGFRSGASTDKANILKLQYDLPSVSSSDNKSNLTAFTFFDIASGKNNLSDKDPRSAIKSRSYSSLGFGVRGAIKNALNYNLVLTHKLLGNQFDKSSAVKKDKLFPRNSAFLTVSYNF